MGPCGGSSVGIPRRQLEMQKGFGSGLSSSWEDLSNWKGRRLRKGIVLDSTIGSWDLGHSPPRGSPGLTWLSWFAGGGGVGQGTSECSRFTGSGSQETCGGPDLWESGRLHQCGRLRSSQWAWATERLPGRNRKARAKWTEVAALSTAWAGRGGCRETGIWFTLWNTGAVSAARLS